MLRDAETKLLKSRAERSWGVAVHESFDSVVAYVVEASVRDGRPVLNRVTAGVHCNLAVNREVRRCRARPVSLSRSGARRYQAESGSYPEILLHQPPSHDGTGPNRSARKSISARTRDERVRLGR
jgi:hypothetical protein